VLLNPIIVSATARNTDAAHPGYLGFTEKRQNLLECSVAYPVQDNLLLAAEYRKKPDKLNHRSGLVGDEDDWWALSAAYSVSGNTSLSLAYANLGTVLNHDEPWSLWLQLKLDF